MNQNLNSPAKPFLSLCMIVKNEAKNLHRCLASAKPYVDEIVVVDTGSDDNTVEIAIEYGAKINYFEWCDDFSAARNYALSQVSGDWILILDADEELVVNSENFLNQLAAVQASIAYSIIRTEVSENDESTPLYTIRLFRNLPDLKYTGRMHEQLIYQNQLLNINLVEELKHIKILHYGNASKEELTQKASERYIPILERARQEEGLSLMLLYCLAGMYNDTQQTEKAQECYAEAFERLLLNLMDGNKPEEFCFIPSLVFSLAGQSLQQQDYETARLLCQRGLEWCPDYPPLNYIAGFTVMDLGFPLAAIPYFQKCLQLGRDGSYYKGEPFEQSFITIDPACGLGLAYVKLQSWPDAIAAFELALSFDANCTAAQQNIAKIRELLTVQ